MCRRARSLQLMIGLLMAGMTSVVPTMAADGEVDAARQNYEHGAEAYDAGNFQEAAEAFARADELSPHPVALEYALRAAMRAERAVLVMQLVERAESRTRAEPLALVAAQARRAFERKAGRILVRCHAEERCKSFTIDGLPATTAAARWVEPGTHVVVIQLGDTRETRHVIVEGGRDVQLEPNQVSPTRPANQPVQTPTPLVSGDTRRTGWSPTWFWMGVGTTAALGAATAISGADTLRKHSTFENDPTDENQESGRGAQTRTNLLLGATALAALTTAAVGAFAVDWDDPGESPNAVGVLWDGSSLVLSVEGEL